MNGRRCGKEEKGESDRDAICASGFTRIYDDERQCLLEFESTIKPNPVESNDSSYTILKQAITPAPFHSQ